MTDLQLEATHIYATTFVVHIYNRVIDTKGPLTFEGYHPGLEN
jgi:hypothetical protein